VQSPPPLVAWGVFRLPFLSGERTAGLLLHRCWRPSFRTSHVIFYKYFFTLSVLSLSLVTQPTHILTSHISHITSHISHFTLGMLVSFMVVLARRAVNKSRHFKRDNSTFRQQIREVTLLLLLLLLSSSLILLLFFCSIDPPPSSPLQLMRVFPLQSNSRAGAAAGAAQAHHRFHCCHILARCHRVCGAVGCSGRGVHRRYHACVLFSRSFTSTQKVG
jgi:hypothetical protein